MSIFAGMSQTALQAQLTALQTAYLELTSGQLVVTASYTQGDGAKSVTYRQTDISNLVATIEQLQRALGITSRRHRRNFRPRYL